MLFAHVHAFVTFFIFSKIRKMCFFFGNIGKYRFYYARSALQIRKMCFSLYLSISSKTQDTGNLLWSLAEKLTHHSGHIPCFARSKPRLRRGFTGYYKFSMVTVLHSQTNSNCWCTNLIFVIFEIFPKFSDLWKFWEKTVILSQFHLKTLEMNF